MVERFRRQVIEAWASQPKPLRREDAVPHHCWECDELWDWFQTLPSLKEQPIPVTPWNGIGLLAPPAMAFVLGHCVYGALSSGECSGRVASILLPGLGARDWDDEVWTLLSHRQQWCLLKLAIWTYRISFDDYEMICRMRRKMRYHEPWPRPRPIPQ